MCEIAQIVFDIFLHIWLFDTLVNKIDCDFLYFIEPSLLRSFVYEYAWAIMLLLKNKWMIQKYDNMKYTFFRICLVLKFENIKLNQSCWTASYWKENILKMVQTPNSQDGNCRNYRWHLKLFVKMHLSNEIAFVDRTCNVSEVRMYPNKFLCWIYANE